MGTRSDFLQAERQRAWAHGREVRNSLIARYKAEYSSSDAPPPAIIIDELLTDFLGVQLVYDPLDKDVFAETEWVQGTARVTVNSMTDSIRGVVDAVGVQNVAKWHEAIHVVDHVEDLKSGPRMTLPGFDLPGRIVCYRSGKRAGTTEAVAKEFWAEEAGRAAAVSLESLAKTPAFQELVALSKTHHGPIRQGFPLLYSAAKDIGVNISALVKQLSLEGRITVVEERGLRCVLVQPQFLRFSEVA